MTREIKFRGKTAKGKWVYGVPYFVADESLYAFIINNCQSLGFTDNDTSFQGVRVLPGTIGQFTGLKDIFGNDVYEGDIVKLTNTGYGFNIGEVKWGLHGNPSFQALEIDAEFPATYHMQVKPQGIEVIGNIHDKETEANHG